MIGMGHTLEIDGVALDFGGRKILQSVYFRVETGRVTGLLGPNGSGKTCLMNMVYGTLSRGGGSVRIDGKYEPVPHKRRKVVKYLPQFAFIPRSLKCSRVFKDYGLRFDEFASVFPDLENILNKRAGELSGGMQRIVEIYIIVKSESLFCMLDEPFSQVMPLHVGAIKKLIAQEKERKGIIVSDHLYENVLDVTDDLYVIQNAEVYKCTEIADLVGRGYVSGLR